jgi:D-glycero-D-manno-heptose 1,7-bisphosphate phosphatase
MIPQLGLRKAVFLDRDGVLNHAIIRARKPYPPQTLEELVLLPGVESACAALRAAGFLLVVVTNQPDIARRTQSRIAVDRMNRWLQRQLNLDAIKVCPHDDSDGCSCRKPKPGLLLNAAEEMRIDLGASFIVGDRWRDIEAGRLAGCTTVWLNRNYDERRPEHPAFTTYALCDAVPWILQADSSVRRE